MTPEQLRLVKESYESLGDSARAVAVDFYRRLFAADPSTESMFALGPDVMAVKFTHELAAIVEAITSYDTFATRFTTSPPGTSPTGSGTTTSTQSARR